MKTIKLIAIALFGSLIFGLSACEEETPEPTPVPAEVKIKFNYVFGPNVIPWNVGDSSFHPKTKDTLLFDLLKFYVSNLKLQKEDGTWWSEPESYHLLCGSCPDESTITLTGMPDGKYIGVEFLMGVDSARNVSGAQTGALSVTNGMFWSWNTGYIMLKIEGHSPNAASGAFKFHLGGFQGTDNVLTTKTTDLSATPIEVAADKSYTLNFMSNLARFWHSSPSVAVRESIHDPGPEATVMAKDFYDNIAFTGME